MRPKYTNQPINKPVRRREPAAKTLAVMSVVIAMMFGVKLFYDPSLPDSDGGREEAAAAAVGAEPANDAEKLTGGAVMVAGAPTGDYAEGGETDAAETTGPDTTA